MKETQCDIFGFAESCVDWNTKNIKHNFHQQCRKEFPSSSISYSNNEFPYTSTYLPGGTIQTAVGHWAGKVTNIISDKSNMGRWSGQSFRLADNKTLSIITAYRPCKQSGQRLSSRTSYHQQYIMLRNKGIDNPDPRSDFIHDIIELITSLENNPNHYIILMMDANESIYESGSGVQKIINSTTLVDTFEVFSKQQINFPTYVRGNKRIDYILSTSNLSPYIKQAGCLPFYDDNLESDHRGQFIDIDNILLDNKIENIRPPRRLIGTKSPQEDIIKYLINVDKQFQTHKIYERCNNLHYDSNIPNKINKKDIQHLLYSLDQQVTEIILSTEQKLCKRIHETEWSIALHHSAIEAKYWMIKYKANSNRKNVHQKLRELLVSLPNDRQHYITQKIHNITNIQEKQEWKIAIKYKNELVKHAKELRKKGMKELYEIRKREGQIETATIINKIAKKENSKHHWETLARIFQKNVKSGINYLEVPDKDLNGNHTSNPDEAVSWKLVTDPVDMNQHLIDRNIKHFGQADGNDFTIDPLLQYLHYEGTSDYVDLLMSGQFEDIIDKANIKSGTKHILHKLNKSRKLNNIDDNISFEDWISSLKSWSERTSTSPSGRHLGHLKVCLANIYTIDKDDLNIHKLIQHLPQDNITEELKNIQMKILQVYYLISIICLQTGNSLPRWQKVTTTMIKKDNNISKINKLRVIHLYEADYNLLLKILWARRLVWNAHDNKSINSGQAGSRPGCNSIDIVILKEMKYLYSRLTKTGLATMDNDAKSCYDRIICNLAMVISRFFGMSKNACNMQGKTLRKMQFRLRTAIGDSSQNYSHSDTTPIHGTGQGSCASPSIWLLISSILMDCLSELAGGMTMVNVTDYITLQEWINGFVDDTSLFCNIKGDDLNKLRDQLCKDMVIWQNLLEASGGKLELSKCFYYILHWKFNNEGDALPMSIKEQLEYTHPITIIDSATNTSVVIQQKEAKDHHKTLGCMKSMDGNEREEINYLKNKAATYIKQLKHSKLSKMQARMAYNCIFIPSLRYGLPSCSLTKNEIDEIQKPAVEQFIRLMGYERSFPRDIAYAHQDFGGLQMPHLYTEMSAMKLEALLSHIRAESALGKALIININTIQLLSGSVDPILKYNHRLNYLDDNWILHLRTFIFEINATIEIDNLWVPYKQRDGDFFIMDEFRKHMSLTDRQFTLVNYWRIFFQVLTISDLCEPNDHNKIQPMFLKEQSDISSKLNKSLLTWPIQQRPGHKGFLLWIKCLKHTFKVNMSTRQMNSKLGFWLPQHHQYNKWEYYMHPTTRCIYHHHNNEYRVYKPTISRSKSTNFHVRDIIHVINDLPEKCIPIYKYRGNDMCSCYHTSKHFELKEYNNIIDETSLTWKEYITKLPLWQQQMIIHTTYFDQELFSSSLLTCPEIYIISDGGVADNQGTFGTILTNKESILFKAHGKCYFNNFYRSSYRAESYAVLAGIISYYNIKQYFNVSNNNIHTIRIYTDNKKLVKNLIHFLRYEMTVNDHIRPDFDVLYEILHVLKLLKSQGYHVECQYVNGKKKKNNIRQQVQLYHEESIHPLAHALAQEAKKLKDVSYITFPHNNVNLQINSQYVTSNVNKIAKKCYHSINARKCLQEKYNWKDTTIENIWWNVHAIALQQLSFHDRIRIQKFLHNHCNTNNRDHKYYNYKNSVCSMCKCNDETEDHILKCRTAYHRQIRKIWIKEIFNHNISIVPEIIRKAITIGLNNWLEPCTEQKVNNELLNLPADIRIVYQKQQLIGWEHFIRGRMSISWGTLINKYLSGTQDNFNAESWGSKLVSINFKHILILWEYRCKAEHGNDVEEIEFNLKRKLLEEANYIRDKFQSHHLQDNNFINCDYHRLQQQDSGQLQAWIVGARILFKKFKNSIKNSRLFRTDEDSIRALEREPG